MILISNEIMTSFIKLLVVVVNNKQTRSIMLSPQPLHPMINIHKLVENSNGSLLIDSWCNI